ncbi:Predicted alpha-1,6-mannanase, GH76 family [Chitinophaga sp. YR627]|uniref:glycoside hydrolase family 76 protein n=1 Tax=Chitinophaga sp. YR627 TaxID=1881041 RepID=UPI0008E2A90A|nr:glycoside hydrolase family 76 protein [Chitinophaga sp. YR627]SFN23171.1 Predicted alpha-1,6-mannanase, GH76 family [Chitinophaga sp. YR627]
MKTDRLTMNPGRSMLMSLTVLTVTIFTGCREKNLVDPALERNPSLAAAPMNLVNSGNADAAIDAFNNAFLVNSGGLTYYKKSINDNASDGTWTLALNIMGMEDAYERTGRAAHKTLVNNLCTSFLQMTPTPWAWDGWNDDIAWMSLCLIRGYHMTGTANFLTAARYGFDMAYARGWDTQYNGGGIWEQQPDMTPAGEAINKNSLSNNPMGKLACLIYQANHDVWYLDRAKQIYTWSRSHLFNADNGQVYTSIDRDNYVDKGSAVYNQGSFVDFANLLYQITGDVQYFNDAKKAVDYVRNNMTTNGIISNNAGYLNTWADEFARGLGHFVRDNRLWSTYYPWMLQNATALWNNRRTDRNICWNGWAQQTPINDNLVTSQFVSAVSWLQFTPGAQPDDIAGMHVMVSKQNGIAIDNAGLASNGAGIVLWGFNNGLNQRWNFTQNEDNSWNIVSQSSWKALDVPGGNTANDVQLVQWTPTRANNQRWWVDKQADGSYRIWNQQTSGTLDNSSSSQNGYKLVQWGWNGGDAQRWLLQ